MYNEEAFTPEEVAKGEHIKLINCLNDMDKDSRDWHEILITSDGYCTIVRWVKRSDCYQHRFEYVDDDQIVMTEVIMPDNSVEYAFDEDDAKYLREEWEKKNKEVDYEPNVDI